MVSKKREVETMHAAMSNLRSRCYAAALLIFFFTSFITATAPRAQSPCTDDMIWAVFPTSKELGDVNDQLLTKSGPTVNQDGTRTFSMRWQGAASSRSASVTITEYSEPKWASKKVHDYGFDNMKGQTKSGMVKLGFGDEGYKTDDIQRPYYLVHKGQFALSYYTSYPGRSGGVPGDQDPTVAKIIQNIAALPCLGATITPPPPPPVNTCPKVSLNASPSKADPSQTITLTASATDPEGDALTLKWAVIDAQGKPLSVAWNGKAVTGGGQVQDTISWKNPAVGQYTIRVSVSDGKCGKTETASTQVLVQAGMQVSVGTDKTTYSPGETVVISGNVRDATGGLAGATLVVDIGGAKLSAITDASGNYTCPFPIPVSATAASYKVVATASYTGYPAISQPTSFIVGGQLEVTLDTDKDYYRVGNNAKIYGYVRHGTAPVKAADVKIIFSYPEKKKTWEEEIQTNPDGYYEATIQINEESWFQTEPFSISVSTDKTVYQRGEPVTINGEIVPNTLYLKVRASKTGFQYGANQKTVKVGLGEKPSEFKHVFLRIVTPWGVNLPPLKIPVSEGKFSTVPLAGYALGKYSINASEMSPEYKHIRLSTTITFEVWECDPATQGQIDELILLYKQALPKGFIRYDKGCSSVWCGCFCGADIDLGHVMKESKMGPYNNICYGRNGFHCAGYRDKVLYFLDNLRFSQNPKFRALLKGLDYGPVKRGYGAETLADKLFSGLSEHHVVILYKTGTIEPYRADDVLVLDPWLYQRPEVFKMREFKTQCPEWANGEKTTCLPDSEYRIENLAYSYPLMGSPVYLNFACKEWQVGHPVSPFLGMEIFQVLIACPVNVLITDHKKRRLGRLENGRFVFEIPNSQLFIVPNEDATPLWLFALAEGIYHTSLKAYRSGSFELVTRGKDWPARDYGTQSIHQGKEVTIILDSSNPSSPLVLPSGEKVYPHEILNPKLRVSLRCVTQHVTEGKPVVFMATVSDQDPQEPLTYQWYLNGQPIGWSGLSPTWQDPTPGTHHVTIMVFDGKEKQGKTVEFTVAPATPLTPPTPTSSIIKQTFLLSSIPPSPWTRGNEFSSGDTVYVWVESQILNKPHTLEIAWIDPFGKEAKRERFELRGWGAGETFWSELQTGRQQMQGQWKVDILVDGQVEAPLSFILNP